MSDRKSWRHGPSSRNDTANTGGSSARGDSGLRQNGSGKGSHGRGQGRGRGRGKGKGHGRGRGRERDQIRGQGQGQGQMRQQQLQLEQLQHPPGRVHPSTTGSSHSVAWGRPGATESAPSKKDSGPVCGQCRDMCSREERAQRELGNDLSEFELERVETSNLGTKLYRTSAAKAVKKYRRSAAGSNSQLSPSQVRDEDTLMRTMRYLVDTVLGKVLAERDVSPQRFCIVYGFLSDRFRAIRQDFIVQQATSRAYLCCLREQAVVHAFTLRYLGPAGLDPGMFDFNLARQQLMQCMAPLIELQRSDSFSWPPQGVVDLEQEARWMDEFEAGHLLHGLGTPHELSLDVPQRSKGGAVAAAQELVAAFRAERFGSFFRGASARGAKWPVLDLFVGFGEGAMLSKALQCFNSLYTSREPLSFMAFGRTIGLEDHSLIKEGARACGMLATSEDCIGFRQSFVSSSNTLKLSRGLVPSDLSTILSYLAPG